jgi:glutaminyl-peptide cyclotransferase
MVTAVIAALALGCVPGGGPSQEPTFTFDKARAWDHLIKQVDFGYRVPGEPAHIECRDYLAAELRKHTDNVRFQEFTHRWSQTGRTLRMWNVVGEQDWADAKVRVVVLAHWDTRPTADMENDILKQRKPIAGANDGASGVAVLLELARVMRQHKPKDLGIMYLFTDGEDLGPGLNEMFLGAEHFAKNLPRPRPDYGILLDMVGDKDLEIPMEPNSVNYAPGLMRDLFNHAHQIGLGKTFPKRNGPWIEDDHIPLNRAGLPTIDLIDFDYPYWHTLQDTPDKCSPESLEKIGRLMESWLRQDPPWRYTR